MDVPVKNAIKALVGRRRTQDTKFLGESITISKLTVAEVKRIQEAAKPLEEGSEDENDGLNVLRTVVRAAVVGGEELSDEDFEGWPIEDLRELSREIMEFSGIAAKEGEGN
jgi:hypothetical protein